MSDPYLPPNPAAVQMPAAEPYRNRPRDMPPPGTVKPASSGFGTGMLVAMVFVVVAVLAAALYYPRDVANPDSGPVVIENDNTTLVPAADATAPAVATPDASAPAIAAPDAGAPAVVVPDPTAPTATTPDAAAPATTDPAVTVPDATVPGSAPVDPAAPPSP